MDVLSEDQVLQANLGQILNERSAIPEAVQTQGRYSLEGFDNEALDFQQLEEFINNDVNNIFPPEDCYGGSGHGIEGGGMQGKANAAHPMSQPSPVVPHYAAHMQQPPMAHSNGQHMQMKHNQHYGHPQLPDSPPDSGSEPYSPADGNQSDQSGGMKGGMLGSMGSIPQQLYTHNQQPHGAPGHSLSPPHQAPHMGAHQAHHTLPSPPSQVPQQVPGMPGLKNPYPMYNGGDPPKLNHVPPHSGPGGPGMAPGGPAPGMPTRPMPQMSAEMLQQHYNSMNSAANQNKKRKFSDSPNNTVTPGSLGPAVMNGLDGLLHIKQEPGTLGDCVEDDFPYELGSEANPAFLDGVYQVIKWQPFTPNKWCALLDSACKELPPPSYRVDADKGFNFSLPDEAFVCQKKNHFQITVHISVTTEPKFVKTPQGPKKADSFNVHFFGIKMESPSQCIKVEQSQSDRSKKPFHPVKVELQPEQVTKLTVGRLHFSETTSNNMRKKGKPNPDQRYFMLVVALQAHCDSEVHMIAAHVCERIIVRASNPGQFDSDVDVLWQKGQTPESVFHAGRVGVNTDRPDEAVTVHGNVKLTGHVLQPSDKRVKENFEECDPKEQLKNVAQLKVYNYTYNKDFADLAGLSDDEVYDTGILAQDVMEVLPDAVRETGDLTLNNGDRLENFLIVNKDRIYMENVGAVKELCKLTDNLENRIDELERMNRKLAKLKRMDSFKSSLSTRSLSSCSTMSRANSTLPPRKLGADDNASTVTGVTVKGTGHRHVPRQRPPSCSSALKPPDAELGGCSNRFIQGTVVILVLVMAFCLVSITTLYIMEKQESEESNWSNGVLMQSGPNRTSTKATTTSTTLVTSLPATTIGNEDHAGDENPVTTLEGLRTTSLPPPSLQSTTLLVPSAATQTPDAGSSPHSAERGPNINSETINNGDADMPLGPTATSGMSMETAPLQPARPGDDSTGHGTGQAGMPGPAGPAGPPGPAGQAMPTGQDSGSVESGERGIYPSSSVPPIDFNPDVVGPEDMEGTLVNGTIVANGTDVNGNATDISHVLPGGIPPLIPQRCLRRPNSCQMFCCSQTLDDPINGLPPYTNKDIKTDSNQNSAVDTNKTFVYQVPISDSSNPTYGHLDGGDSAIAVSRLSPASLSSNDKMNSDLGPLTDEANDAPAIISLDYLDSDYPGRKRRSVDPETAPATRPDLKTSIRIIQNNQSIDSVYCQDDQCRLGFGGNYSYQVPISQYFPMASVTLQFHSAAGLAVAFCTDDLESQCDDESGLGQSQHYVVTSAGPQHWDLPVGYYMTSMYRFRVTTADSVTQICSIGNQDVGQTFAEYRLNFYRMCPKEEDTVY